MIARRNRQRGFTLIELAVVVAIIGVIAALLVSVSGRTYGANATSMSTELATTLNYARTRALSTRKIHLVSFRFDLTPPEVNVWAASTSGMAMANFVPSTAQFVQRLRVPSGVTLFGAEATAKSAGQTPTQSTAAYEIYFLPDGSATASTIYVTDTSNSRNHRVLVYHATGSSYARQAW